MAEFDTLIINGMVFDGSGGPRKFANVGIRDGEVAAVGPLAGATSANVIDAAGKVVALGHVTQHAHYDAALFWDPYCLDSGEHGMTIHMIDQPWGVSYGTVTVRASGDHFVI